jgi:hypothetical protein
MLGFIWAGLQALPSVLQLLQLIGKLVKEHELDHWLKELVPILTKLTDPAVDRTVLSVDLNNHINKLLHRTAPPS